MIVLVGFCIAIVCVLLWIGVLAPAILRAFGVPRAMGIRRIDRGNQRLSRTQYIWACGVFEWGGGMFVFSTVSNYVGGLFGDRFAFLSPGRMIGWLLTWLAGGWLFGILTAPHREGTDLSGR
jgi:hypothetical protein